MVSYLTYAQAFACQEEQPQNIPDLELVFNSTTMVPDHHYVYENGISGVEAPWSALLGIHCLDKNGCQSLITNVSVAIAYTPPS